MEQVYHLRITKRNINEISLKNQDKIRKYICHSPHLTLENIDKFKKFKNAFVEGIFVLKKIQIG